MQSSEHGAVARTIITAIVPGQQNVHPFLDNATEPLEYGLAGPFDLVCIRVNL
jgi:hypothetical protein